MRLLLNGLPARGAYTGVGSYTWNLAEQLDRRSDVEAVGVFAGWDIVNWREFAAAVEGGELARADGRWRQVARTALPPLRRAFARWRAGAFRRGVARDGWSLYHETNYIPQPFTGPTVTTVHDMSFMRMPQFLPRDRLKWLKENFRDGLARTHRVIVDSHFSRDELLALCAWQDPEQVRVTHLGVDERFFAAGAAAPDPLPADLGLPSRYLLFVGTLEPRKNLQGLLRAHAALPDALQRAYPLLITGRRGWRQRYFWKELERLKLRGTVRTLGYVPHALVPALMRSATLLCYPSHYEGFGLCPLQAAACGTAVVAADIPPLHETLGEAALFADPREPEAIAEALRRGIEDDALRERLQKLGRERAALFTWERCAEQTLEVYRELLG